MAMVLAGEHDHGGGRRGGRHPPWGTRVLPELRGGCRRGHGALAKNLARCGGAVGGGGGEGRQRG